MKFSILSALSLLSLTAAAPASETRSNKLPVPIDVVHTFPFPTWVQDLAVRANGKVLVTLLTTPDVYEVDALGSGDATLVHHFPKHLGMTGITELQPDVFYVAGGNVSILAAASGASPTNLTLSGASVPGAWDIYKIDMSSGYTRVDKVAHIGQAIDIDGMTGLDENHILFSDSIAGVVFKLNVNSGQYDVVLDDPALKNTAAIAIGVHKLRIRDGDLYFDNSAQGTFAKIPIHADGSQAGKAVILSKNINSNGFDFDTAGDAFLTENTPNAIGFVPLGGGPQKILAGPPLTAENYIPGPQSAQFGRTAGQKKILYITTTGGLASQLGEPGTLSKIDIGASGFWNKV